MRLIDADALFMPDEKSDKVYILGGRSGKTVALAMELLKKKVADATTIEAEPVRHGRWDSKYDEHDGFYHHFCTECKHLAIFTYDERDDYDEGMDGEWYFLGKDIVGIKENLTNCCPNCGAKMDLED